jgi:hypothetical protein
MQLFGFLSNTHYRFLMSPCLRSCGESSVSAQIRYNDPHLRNASR